MTILNDSCVGLSHKNLTTQITDAAQAMLESDFLDAKTCTFNFFAIASLRQHYNSSPKTSATKPNFTQISKSHQPHSPRPCRFSFRRAGAVFRVAA